MNVPDPNNDAYSIEADEVTKDPVWKPVPIHSLVEEGFRAVKIVAGDSFSAAISDEGQLRAWGAFSVRTITHPILGIASLADCRATKVSLVSPATQKSSTNPSPSLSSRMRSGFQLRQGTTTSFSSPPLATSTLSAPAKKAS